MTVLQQDTGAPPMADIVAAWRALLPPWLSRRLHDNQTLSYRVRRAIDVQGWTVKQLAAECVRDQPDPDRACQRVMWRLEQAAAHPAPTRGQNAPRRHRPGCSGWVEDPDSGLPVSKCTGCVQ